MKFPEGGKPDFSVSNRGVHGRPAAYHRWYLEDKGIYWANLLQSMGISWIVLITDGDSVLEPCDVPGWGLTTPLEFFLAHQVVPIVRDGTDLLPKPFTNWHAVERAVPIYTKYGMKPLWICRNEPFDSREWVEGIKPPKADATGMEFVCGIIQGDMDLVARSGGVPGFPDGPCYSLNPFDYLDRTMWDHNRAFYAGHYYGKGRPIGYPYDDVTRFGTPLTEESYSIALDDYAGEPAWRDVSLETINARRAALVNPDLTAIEDPVCWRGWERVWWHAQETLGYVPAMAMTEGGWTPRDRAGSGADMDVRWPLTTPNKVAEKTLAMYHDDSPHFAICPWLLADDAMLPDGYVGWPYESWVGWAYTDKYDYEKPVVKILQDNPPGPTPGPDVDAALVEFRAAQLAGQRMLAHLEE